MTVDYTLLLLKFAQGYDKSGDNQSYSNESIKSSTFKNFGSYTLLMTLSSCVRNIIQTVSYLRKILQRLHLYVCSVRSLYLLFFMLVRSKYIILAVKVGL